VRVVPPPSQLHPILVPRDENPGYVFVICPSFRTLQFRRNTRPGCNKQTRWRPLRSSSADQIWHHGINYAERRKRKAAAFLYPRGFSSSSAWRRVTFTSHSRPPGQRAAGPFERNHRNLRILLLLRLPLPLPTSATSAATMSVVTWQRVRRRYSQPNM